MNLIAGKWMNDIESRAALKGLYEQLLTVRAQEALNPETVIAACDALSKKLNFEEHLPLLTERNMPMWKAQNEFFLAKTMLSREYLTQKIKNEIDVLQTDFVPFGSSAPVRQVYAPLGVLFHIAAGNVDALPVFSVIEGLLSGNINLLKLPGGTDDLSMLLIRELIAIEPALAPYIYVFDYPSKDLDAMQQLADLSDAIVIWGGDEAVRAVRQMAKPNTQIIEWGHKISFAYVSGDVSDAELEKIAHHICETDQLFCSSCQGIFLDTEDFNEVLAFSSRFSTILERTAENMPNIYDPYRTAQITLKQYTEQLETFGQANRIFRGRDTSVTAYPDMQLLPSLQFRNCWVRPLPQSKILPTLIVHKNRLQTVMLVCSDERRGALEKVFIKAGVVRITSGKNEPYCGSPHDGTFALRRYMKIVSYE